MGRGTVPGSTENYSVCESSAGASPAFLSTSNRPNAGHLSALERLAEWQLCASALPGDFRIGASRRERRHGVLTSSAQATLTIRKLQSAAFVVWVWHALYLDFFGFYLRKIILRRVDIVRRHPVGFQASQASFTILLRCSVAQWQSRPEAQASRLVLGRGQACTAGYHGTCSCEHRAGAPLTLRTLRPS